MRVKQPEAFDPKKEYKIGERAIYNGLVIIAEKWGKWDKHFSNKEPAKFAPRCIRCKIERADCPGLNLQCDPYSRKDRKTIYWRVLRAAPGFKTEVKIYSNFNGGIWTEIKAKKIDNE